MIRWLAGRLLQGVLVVFLVVTITFVLLHAAPGDPLTALADQPRIPPEVVQQIRRNYGLDQPVHVQYLRYVGRVLRGDLGLSLTRNRPVLAAIVDALPETLLLAGAGLLVDFTLGIGIGVLQAVRHRTWVDRLLSGVTVTLYSTPVFWLGLMFIWLFGEVLGWFPLGGPRDLVTYAQLSLGGRVLNRLHHLALPALTLGLIGAAATARYQRAAMLEVIGQDFVRTARAKGLAGRLVILRHTLRNALLPVITLAGLAFPVLLSGTVLVEWVFSWPGMGRLAADAILRRDYPLVAGTAMLAATMVVLGNVLADLAARAADPRTGAPA